MKIDLYSAAGAKKGSLDLPADLFEAPINKGLMHLALIRQQSNRRRPIAHVKHRDDVIGTTTKAYAQKHTGRARRGALRSPILRGGGKSFGPRNEANFRKDMPRKMRRAALLSCLSMRAKEGVILGLENYPEDPKTKNLATLLGKLPVAMGRRIVLVTAGRHEKLELAARNIPRVKTVFAQYLNPEDLLLAQHIIFLEDAVKLAADTFGKDGEGLATKKAGRMTEDIKATAEAVSARSEKEPREPKGPKGQTKKAVTAPKSAKKTSVPSDTSVPSASSPSKKPKA